MELFTLRNVTVRSTFSDKSILIIHDGKGVWIPKSQIKEVRHMDGCVVMTTWIAKKKGLI